MSEVCPHFYVRAALTFLCLLLLLTLVAGLPLTMCRNTLMYLRGQELTLPAEKGKANGSDRALAVLASFKPANIA
jgi:hypothetical protein